MAAAFASMGIVAASAARAADGDDNGLQALTVTATRLPQPSFTVPASVDVRTLADDALDLNVSEALQDVPGVLARERQNYAQDTQLSIRGFGARASFGVRGIRIYIDGIPQSQPDGQGQVSQFNLASAGRVEVLRGPFSALYGNSSGGVIELFTAMTSGTPQLTSGLLYGSFDTWRGSADLRGGDARSTYNVGVAVLDTAGSRGHSAAQRTTLQAEERWQLAGETQLTLLGNYFVSPAQDPLGLTQAQFAANPQALAPTAAQFNTRKDASQGQGGALLDVPLSASDDFRLMGYGGGRHVLQFLAIPVTVQAAPTSPGGVVDLDETFFGAEPRWTHTADAWGGRLNVTVGLSYDQLDERRRGYLNFDGAALGVIGALARDEDDDEHDLDEYLQAEWQTADGWTVTTGMRHSSVRFGTVDRYFRPGSTAGNGSTAYEANSPVAGALYHLARSLDVYASYGDGFETPTFTELAYRPDGSAGLNSALRAARSHNIELGMKLMPTPHVAATLAVFQTRSANELAVLSNVGGRSTYTNIPQTRRLGAELSLQGELATTLRWQLAYTYLDAYVGMPYETCPLTNCASANTLVAGGRRLPGVTPHHVDASLRWQPWSRWELSLEDEYVATVYADDANTAYARPYDLVDVAVNRVWQWAHSSLRVFMRADNLLDRRYAGSVIVNNSNAQYFEGGPGRAMFVGANWQWP